MYGERCFRCRHTLDEHDRSGDGKCLADECACDRTPTWERDA